MGTRYHLGATDEAIAGDVLTAWELGQGFEVQLLAAPAEATLAEVATRLQEAGAVLKRAHPEELPEQLLRWADEPQSSGPRSIVWVEAKTFDRSRWGVALRMLNERREWLEAHVPGLLILAGPPELLACISHEAPDLWSVSTLKRLFHGAPRLVKLERAISILLFSGTRLRADERWERRPELTTLVEHLARARDAGARPDLLVVTGDIAASGRPEEYEQAERFFSRLAEALDHHPERAWFMVPGRGDLDLRRMTRPRAWILERLTDEEQVAALMRDEETFAAVLSPLEPYFAFTRRLLGPTRASSARRPWRTDTVDVGGLRIAVAQLNSVFGAAGASGASRWVVGAVQAAETALFARQAQLRVAASHLPFSALEAFDAKAIEEVLTGADEIDALLHAPAMLAASTVAEPGFGPARLVSGELAGGGPPSIRMITVGPETVELRSEELRFEEPSATWRSVGASAVGLGS